MNMDERLEHYLADCLDLLRRGGIVLPRQARVTFYHHEGLPELEKTGALFLNIVDRDYCKSYVVMKKGQRYPSHYHQIKTESFYMLWGQLRVELDGTEHRLEPGDLLSIERGQDHAFSTDTGAVFEEISTRYVPNDSVYLEERIRRAPYSFRRTVLTQQQWEEARQNA